MGRPLGTASIMSYFFDSTSLHSIGDPQRTIVRYILKYEQRICSNEMGNEKLNYCSLVLWLSNHYQF
jgi:hypothetical protein